MEEEEDKEINNDFRALREATNLEKEADDSSNCSKRVSINLQWKRKDSLENYDQNTADSIEMP